MRSIKIQFILVVFSVLLISCESAVKVEDPDLSDKNTLNKSDLGSETGYVHDYFFNFDEEVDALYLYYNS